MLVRYIAVAAAIISGGIWVRVLCTQSRYRWISLVPLTYIGHMILFYAFYHLHLLTNADINVWSTALRLHGITTVLALGLLLLYERLLR